MANGLLGQRDPDWWKRQQGLLQAQDATGWTPDYWPERGTELPPRGPDQPSIYPTPSLLNRISTYTSTIPRRVSDFAQGAFYGGGAGALRVTQGLLPKEQPRMAAMEQWGQEQVPDSPEGQAGGLLGSIAPEFTIAGDIADLARVPDYLKEREWVSGGLAALAAVPVVGTPVAKGIDAMRGADAAIDLGRARDVGKVKDRHPDGSYVGGPRYQGTTKLDNPETLKDMRDEYIHNVIEGMGGRDWYRDAGRWIEGAVPPGMEDEVAQILGITSAQADVSTNLGFAVDALNQAGVGGAPIRAGRFPGAMGPKIEGVVAGEDVVFGPKIGPFWENLRLTGDSKQAETAVHDIWQGRAFGYEHISQKGFPSEKAALDSITDAKGNVKGRVFKEGKEWKTAKPWDAAYSGEQHAFMDEQMDEIVKFLNDNKIGGHTDWNHANAQAAAWSGIQIKSGRISPDQAALHFGDYSPRYAANATYEQVPRTGEIESYPGGHKIPDERHLPSVADLPYDEKVAFGEETPWTRRGLDVLYSAAGQIQEGVRSIRGIFRNPDTGRIEYNPGTRAGMLAQSRGGEVVPQAREILDTVEGGRAFVDTQNAGAWHHIIPNAQTRPLERTSLHITLDGSPTDEQLRALQKIAEREGMFVVDTGRGVNLIEDSFVRPKGINELMEKALKDKRSLTPTEVEKLQDWGLYGETLGKRIGSDLGAEITEILPGSNLQRVKVDSGYVDYADLWKTEGSREATTKFLDDTLRNPELARALEPELRAKAAANLKRNQEYAERTGDVVRQDIMNALRILSEQGLRGLRTAVQNNQVLPSVAILGALGLRHLAPADARDGQPPSGLLR